MKKAYNQYITEDFLNGEFHLSKNGLFFVCASCSRNTPIKTILKPKDIKDILKALGEKR